jgi:hypothetical protein
VARHQFVTERRHRSPIESAAKAEWTRGTTIEAAEFDRAFAILDAALSAVVAP